ncbi:MAG: hypothetical protein V4548_03780 [Bacteroidota bacterium]
MIGTWKGYYKYDNERIQKAIGFDKTNFTITIDSFDGINFQGKVNDDLTTGGMKETGDIYGKFKDGEISFKKLMPKASLIMDLEGTRKNPNKKHKPLYYCGTFSKDKNEFNGSWKFKYTIGFLFGIIPIPYRPGNGTWQMKLKNLTI